VSSFTKLKLHYRTFLILFSIVFFSAGFCHASEDAIEIVKSQGGVITSEAAGEQGQEEGSKGVFRSRNILSTGPKGRAVVRVGKTGFIIIEKNSKVEIESRSDNAGFFRHVTGMIYYALNALKGDQRRTEVRTASATLGIRGTRFLVTDMPERNEIGMRKGTVDVISPDSEFEIHRKAELDEFEAFKQEGRDAIAKEKKEFETYKADMEREFVEYKREFSLGANRMASFDGKRVQEGPLSEETRQDMESLEQYAEEWLKEVND